MFALVDRVIQRALIRRLDCVRMSAIRVDVERSLDVTVEDSGEDHAARLWPVPAPAAGTPDQVALWAEVLTGLALDANDVTHMLGAADWHTRHGRLRELGGTPLP